jgi:hypothetical protein
MPGLLGLPLQTISTFRSSLHDNAVIGKTAEDAAGSYDGGLTVGERCCAASPRLHVHFWFGFLPVISSYRTPRNAPPAPKTTHNGTPTAVPRAAIPAPWLPNRASPTAAPPILSFPLGPRSSQASRLVSRAIILTAGTTTLLLAVSARACDAFCTDGRSEALISRRRSIQMRDASFSGALAIDAMRTASNYAITLRFVTVRRGRRRGEGKGVLALRQLRG